MDDMKYLIEKMNQELNEFQIRDIARKTGAFLAKVPQAIKRVYQKMVGVVKKIESAFFRFGAAICQLKNNKFALFNSKGKMLTPQLDFMQRTKLGKKLVPKYESKQAKLKRLQGWLQPDGRVAVAKGYSKEDVPVYYFGDSLFKPNLVHVESLKVSPAEKIILEELLTEAIPQKEREKQYTNVKKQAFVDFDDQTLVQGIVKEEPREIAESTVTVSDLEEVMDDMATATEAGGIKGRKISAFVYGPPGVGKSEIITNYFKKLGYEITLLQIQHVPIEILSGFPVIKTTDATKDGERVKMVASEILPPQKSKKRHLLFLDEFNAGSQEQMKAAMNLALNGNIGTYELPEKTIIIAAGNAPERDNAAAVNTLDAPVLRRFIYKLDLKPDLPEWLKFFASKDVIIDWKGKKINTGPVLSIITYNLVHWSEEAKDPSAAFRKVMKGFGGEEETGWLDPATWTALDKVMKIRGIREFAKLPEDKRKLLEEHGKKRYKNLDAFSAGVRLYINGMQQEILKRVGPRVLGKDSEEIVSEMIMAYNHLKNEKVNPLDILLNYKAVREKAKKANELGAEILFRELAEEIITFGSIKAMKQFMKEKGIEYYKSAKEDPLTQALINVGQFIKDKNIGSEIIVAHFEALNPGVLANNQLALRWKEGLLHLKMPQIQEAWDAFNKTIDEQFEELADEEEKEKFMQLKREHKTYIPEIAKVAKRIKDPKLRQSFIDTENKRFILYFGKTKQKKRQGLETLPAGYKMFINRKKPKQEPKPLSTGKHETKIKESISLGLDVDSETLEEMLSLAGIK